MEEEEAFVSSFQVGLGEGEEDGEELVFAEVTGVVSCEHPEVEGEESVGPSFVRPSCSFPGTTCHCVRNRERVVACFL